MPKTAAEQQHWINQRAVIAKHRAHAAAARQQARYDPEALETAAYHDAEAERLEAELEAAGHLRPRGARYRPNPHRPDGDALAAKFPRLVRSELRGDSSHPEARQRGDKILLFPKFFNCNKDQKVFILLHELGHWFRQENVELAAIMGFEPGEGFFDLFGAGNSEEGFAEAFAVMLYDEGELKKRYPEQYQQLRAWLRGHDVEAMIEWANEAAESA